VRMRGANEGCKRGVRMWSAKSGAKIK